MRLIDVDSYCATICRCNRGACDRKKCPIHSAPTAYNISEVVNELFKLAKENHGNAGMGGEMVVNLDDAVDIVKQGGVCGGCTEVGGCPVREDCPNEPNVCEWKCKGGFIKNPHTNRIYSNEESMKNIYCNTCGKKIKVVE